MNVVSVHIINWMFHDLCNSICDCCCAGHNDLSIMSNAATSFPCLVTMSTNNNNTSSGSKSGSNSSSTSRSLPTATWSQSFHVTHFSTTTTLLNGYMITFARTANGLVSGTDSLSSYSYSSSMDVTLVSCCLSLPVWSYRYYVPPHISYKNTPSSPVTYSSLSKS